MTRTILLAFGLASATLYCGLMPLWEGFDEFYHYGYVQHLANTGSFPQIGETHGSMEPWTSLDFAPVSHYTQPYLQRPSTSFEEYFNLSPDDRAARRSGLESMDRRLQEQASPRANYEAMQAPLTYLLLAPLERTLSGRAITTRVLVLRLFLSGVALLLLWVGVQRLAAELGMWWQFHSSFSRPVAAPCTRRCLGTCR